LVAKVEGVPLIAVGVEDEADGVVGAEARVAPHLRADDTIRLRVVGHHPDIEVVLVVEDCDVGLFRGRIAFARLPLRQRADLRRRTPDLLVEETVDVDAGGNPCHHGRFDRSFGRRRRHILRAGPDERRHDPRDNGKR
jgi:hypothetical protein